MVAGIRDIKKAMAGMDMNALKDMMKIFKVLEDNQITMQENQVEFEKYLTDILIKLDTLIEYSIMEATKDVKKETK